MPHVIEVTVRDKIATAAATLYVCGNSDYVVRFSFDAEWSEHETKTARFIYGSRYQDVIFEGDECPVPIISNAYGLKIGVFAGNLRTTTPAYIPTERSILCGHGAPDDPPADVYHQIMEMLNMINDDIGAAVKDYLENHPIEGDFLPEVTEADDGKVLTVEGGEWAAKALPAYNGAYIVTPSTSEEQTLQTAQKYMDADVTVQKVPYFEVSNNANGITATIGEVEE